MLTYFQAIREFYEAFKHNVLEKFQTSEINMAGVSNVFSKSHQSGFLLSLSSFRSVLKDDFDTPMRDFILGTASSMNAIYIGILDQLIAGKYYYGARRDLQQLGSSLNIWKIPVSILCRKFHKILDDVIKWKHFPRYWPFVRGIHRSPAQRPVTQSFDVFFDLRLNKRLSKQAWGWWSETPSRPLCRHCNVFSHIDKCKWNLFAQLPGGASWVLHI